MNINVTCVDCLRKDSVGKRMQEFLDNGVEFTQCYAAAPSTIPSVATCLTGALTGHHGMIDPGKKEVLVPTICDEFRKRGFKTIGYSANNMVDYFKPYFDEWHHLNWLNPQRTKQTQESYGDIWTDISTRKGDNFFYVHLMDVHGPYRSIESVSIHDFPADHRKFALGQWINDRAAGKIKEPGMNDQQWKWMWELYQAEVEYLDQRIEFPGDLAILMSDHGEMVGETYRGGRWLSHACKHFVDAQLHTPFGVKGLGVDATSWHGGSEPDLRWGGRYGHPFCTRFLGELIFAILDKKPWKGWGDLYWEDYMYDTAHFAYKDSKNPKECLVLSSDGEVIYNQREAKLEDVPSELTSALALRKVKAGTHFHLFDGPQEEQSIVEERLRNLGYIE